MTLISELPLLERPIERLINNDASILTNEELIAILLNTGTKRKSSKALSIEIISKAGSIEKIKNLTLNDLLSINGIGNKKAATILAAIELSKRINSNILIRNKKIHNSLEVFNYYKDICKDLTQEHFYCLYLDVKKHIILNKLLFVGTINYSMVHPRDIFREAYLNHATSIICIHNHPSGDITPSIDDIKLTKSLVEIGILMGVKIDDHIIIGKDKYYSFFEENKL